MGGAAVGAAEVVGREKVSEFNRAVVQRGIVGKRKLARLAAAMPVDSERKRLILDRVKGDFAAGPRGGPGPRGGWMEADACRRHPHGGPADTITGAFPRAPHPWPSCRACASNTNGGKTTMAIGNPEETRAFARLPGLDVAVLHRAARGGGEEVVVAVRTAPSFAAIGRPAGFADPFLLWMGLAQAAWVSWLACFAAAGAPPWIAGGD